MSTSITDYRVRYNDQVVVIPMSQKTLDKVIAEDEETLRTIYYTIRRKLDDADMPSFELARRQSGGVSLFSVVGPK